MQSEKRDSILSASLSSSSLYSVITRGLTIFLATGVPHDLPEIIVSFNDLMSELMMLFLFPARPLLPSAFYNLRASSGAFQRLESKSNFP